MLFGQLRFFQNTGYYSWPEPSLWTHSAMRLIHSGWWPLRVLLAVSGWGSKTARLVSTIRCSLVSVTGRGFDPCSWAHPLFMDVAPVHGQVLHVHGFGHR